MEGTAHAPVSFQHSDPVWRVPISLPQTGLAPGDIRPGDLIYTRRAKGYQRLTALAGDTWRHVGVAVTIAGFTWMAAMTPAGNAAHPLSSALDRYDTIAIQRLTPCARRCNIAFLNKVIADMNAPTAFHDRTELASIGLLSLSRLDRTGERFEKIRYRMAKRLLERSGFEDRSICTTLIARNLDLLCDQHQPVLDTWSPKHNSPRFHAPASHHQMALPDDLWRALAAHTDTFWVKKDGEFPVIDLTHEQEGEPIMTLGH